MIRKLMCWLGWHEWFHPCWICLNKGTKWCKKCGLEFQVIHCKHCGKVKK